VEAHIANLRVVISAVSFTEGGPLTVLRECLAAAATTLPKEWEIFVLVNSNDLIQEPRVRQITIASAKRSWFHRLYWEWFGFMNISRKLNPSLWLSLHDITPRVLAKRRVVYCHNPSPFYKLAFLEALQQPKFLFFNFFYKYLYQIQILKNYAVVVQQEWLRNEFYKIFGHPNIIVAHPLQQAVPVKLQTKHQSAKFIFLYPVMPRFFKNLEVLCTAAESLGDELQDKFEIRLTIDGTENRYARNLFKRFNKNKTLNFIGKQSHQQMCKQYAKCDAVLFPSKLETWGLPISEAKAYSKPILVADMPYAYETVGTYSSVLFLDPEDPLAWANAIKKLCERSLFFSGNSERLPVIPYARDWRSLWDLLVRGL
jgi:glycosyltransferase involved in cell wall biosynthesis